MNSIDSWIASVIEDEHSWEGNNLHIDEIEPYTGIKREDWVGISLETLRRVKELQIPHELLLFLHIDLSESIEKEEIETFTIDWLEENVNEYTPPSLNCTSLQYYMDFYKEELKSVKLQDHLSFECYCFYRTYYDDSEDAYAREIYIFRGIPSV